MAKPNSGPFARYLHDVQRHLRSLTPEQRERVLAELSDHLDDAAQQAGADSHDPAFQAALVQRMGSSEKLGRALAQAHRAPHQRAYYVLNMIGGAAALLSAVLVATAFPVAYLLGSYQWMVDTLVGAPAALIPTMVALHTVYRTQLPRQSRWVLLCGLVGVLFVFFSAFWHDIIELVGLHDTVLHVPIDVLSRSPGISEALLGLVGVWLILLSHLSARTGIPRDPHFAWMSMAAGASTLILLLMIAITGIIYLVFGGIPPGVQSVGTLLWPVTLLGWFVCYIGWAVGTGLWLLQRRTYLPPSPA